MTNEATELKIARAKVNAEKFGTQAWEDAMQIVREMVASIESAKPASIYTSIDGDIFDRR